MREIEVRAKSKAPVHEPGLILKCCTEAEAALRTRLGAPDSRLAQDLVLDGVVYVAAIPDAGDPGSGSGSAIRLPLRAKPRSPGVYAGRFAQAIPSRL